MRTFIASAAAALLFGAGTLEPVKAQQQDPRRDARQRNQAQARPQPGDRQRAQGQRRQPTRGRVTGEIVKTKRVDIRGTDVQHLVVLLKTERGNRVPIDLGRPSRLGERAPNEGDRITVDGRLVRIGDRNVIIGEQLHAGDAVVRLEHQPPFQREPGRQQARQTTQREPRQGDQRTGQTQGQRDRFARQERRQGERPAGLGVRLAYDRRVEGVRVLQVVPGSPAAQAGIRSGDVITLVEDEYVTTPQQLIEAVAEKQPGERVAITVVRGGQSGRLTVQLASRQDALRPDAPERAGAGFEQYR